MRFFTHAPIQSANHTELAGHKKETEGSEQQLYCYGGTLGFYKDSALLVFSSSLSSPPAPFSHIRQWGISPCDSPAVELNQPRDGFSLLFVS